MARRFHIKSSSKDNLNTVARAMPVKLFIIGLILLAIGVPTFFVMSKVGLNFMPKLTELFYTLSSPAPPATPTPLPPFPQALPQPGSVSYTIQDGDNCVGILAYEMNMNMAGQVFSDSKPETVTALNKTLGKDCHLLQPGMNLSISPHYPLVALGGTVQKIESQTPHQVIPTPLIHVPQSPDEAEDQKGTDCSGGCKLTVRINPQTQVYVMVSTELPVRNGSWVWFQAMMARKSVKGFNDYPYADPKVSFNKMTLSACDFQVDDKHDDNSLSCSRLTPNTIRADGGAWLLGVTGSGSLDHWKYSFHLPPNTKVLVWLSYENGHLVFKGGNPLYRYNEATHLYEKVKK